MFLKFFCFRFFSIIAILLAFIYFLYILLLCHKVICMFVHADTFQSNNLSIIFCNRFSNVLVVHSFSLKISELPLKTSLILYANFSFLSLKSKLLREEFLRPLIIIKFAILCVHFSRSNSVKSFSHWLLSFGVCGKTCSILKLE